MTSISILCTYMYTDYYTFYYTHITDVTHWYGIGYVVCVQIKHSFPPKLYTYSVKSNYIFSLLCVNEVYSLQ